MIESATEHCQLMDELGFDRYVVSLKDSDPAKVVEINQLFAARRRTFRCTWVLPKRVCRLMASSRRASPLNN